MQLSDFIAKECIVPDLEFTHKPDVLKELTHVLFEEKKMKDMSTAMDQIMARESTESTGIGNGIAVPHARISGLKSLVCAVGRSREGIDFMAVDRNSVHLIFLICYPPAQQTTYLNFVASIAKLLRNENNLKSLLEAEDADAIYAEIERLGQKMEAPEETFSAAPAENGEEVELDKTKDAHADLILLARLQLNEELHETARTGKRQIKQRIENIRALIDPRLLKHYDRLMKSRQPALVPVEGDTCQGCFMKLPSQFAQRVRLETDHIHTCSNCRRFIYVV